MPNLDGIDVSMWQGTIDWSQVATLNLKFVCFQLGWRNDNGQRAAGIMELDPQYRRNVERSRLLMPTAKKIHYLVPINKPWKTQLDQAMAAMGSLPANETMMFDVEYPQVVELGFENVVAMVREAAQRLQRRVFWYGGGYFPSNASWIEDDRIADIPKWFAAYSTKEAMLTTHAQGVDNLVLWQWGGGAQGAFIPGIHNGTARVDSNEIIDLAAFNAVFGGPLPTMNPAAVPKLLSTWDVKNGAKRRTITPRVIVLHTNAAGSAVSLQSNWNHAVNGGTQAHFQVQGGWHSDGTVGAYQFLPTDREGVGSWNGDPFAITIETQDNGATPIEKLRTTPWTPAQVEAIAQVCAVECKRWNIPVRLANAWNGSGIGYHRQWGVNTKSVTSKGQGLPVGSLPGYVNPWTKTSGKTCPENARIAQVPTIIARTAQIMAAGGGGQLPPPTPPTEVPNVAYFMDRSVPDPKPVYEIVGGSKLHVTGDRIPELQAVFGADWINKVPSLPAAYLAGLPAYTSGGTGPQGPPGPKGDKGDPGEPGGLAPHTHAPGPVVPG